MSTSDMMKNASLPKIRASQEQVSAARTFFNQHIDATEDLNEGKAKYVMNCMLQTLFEVIEKPEITMVGMPGKLMRVEVFGEQGAGKSLLLNLIDTVDRSVRSENLEFHQSVSALTGYVHDYGIRDMVDATGGLVPIHVAPGYDGLFGILRDALDQAQQGKGNERHNPTGAIPFEEQRMQTISRMIGSVKGMEYQAIKKLTEGLDMPELDRQVKELLGVINYVAGIVIFLRAKNLAERANDELA